MGALERLPILGWLALTSQRQLDLTPHGGEGGAQLVTRIGGEPALGLEGGLDPAEHGVQDLDQAPVLRGVGVRADPVLQVGGTQSLGLADDVVHGAERAGGQPAPTQHSPEGREEHERDPEPRDPPEHGVTGLEGGRDLQYVFVVKGAESDQGVEHRADAVPCEAPFPPYQGSPRRLAEGHGVDGEILEHVLAPEETLPRLAPHLGVAQEIHHRSGLLRGQLPLVKPHLSRLVVRERGRLNGGHVQDAGVQLRIQDVAEGDPGHEHAKRHSGGGQGPESKGQCTAEGTGHHGSDRSASVRRV